MRNKDLCEAFVEGATEGKGSNMHIRDNEIFSYAACIGRFEKDGTLSLNPIKYSLTTSKHQGYLHRAAEYANIKYAYKENF